MNDTITAIATPNINSAISIIRISGPNTYEIVSKITKKEITKTGYTFVKEFIYQNDLIIDEVIILKYVAPKSFTGEDLIEINCHGGVLITNKILDLILESGARLAENGEFTKRAFLNNKLTLRQANSINNLIFSKTDIATNLSSNGIINSNNDFFLDIKEKIFYLIGKIEVNIDYPEYEDVEQVTAKEFNLEVKEIIDKLNKTINDFNKVSYLYNGLNVVIVGKPNVGKSSLLNSLIKKNKAIVSDIKGTTRDLVTESINLEGLLLNFIDTAGIRESKNKIENIGIKKTMASIKEADLILFLIDDSKKIDKKEKEILNLIKNKNYIIVKNKSDLKVNANSELKGISISALKKDVKPLVNEIKTNLKQGDFNIANNLAICSDNELKIIKQVLLVLKKSYANSLSGFPLDLLVEDLKVAYEKICTIMGLSEDLNIIDKMFKNFCLGK
ncbi:tRNA uridine-5-carboxymethylaminomethyl(34) synthesis GTPase MnmE [Malacoplasma penetrans]|uniref:tRNA modification GTPase MnmE n=1 Tax=Malacoplasma penetrans (strain HF-2) TaxID=272633 RepID=MNME_MALP2|nr:tRNA uridine-5-carboxymethylaminomethyl(34) synthesis GTPase MnmE [Malacoplasma penetrans]Q8EUV6.1 RecName: Full=tRNA modification GTPase MnmE [Malacoplasma penetrans HF-2]RXY96464.1 tRNA uridine-5-carboxymethylaminomethyl(34) synthesis GTPase MnmE [Malacoplasma penetrans]BAC44605.1 thiophene and furan oxidation protein-related GTPase [Malacoplasma penetrans HF-2]